MNTNASPSPDGAETAVELWAVAEALADIARRETLDLFRRAIEVTSKEDDFDPVTAADRAAEKAMRAHLSKHRPHDGILGEEFAPVEGTSGLTWVLDPIDGTRGYISGTPTWGVLIAVSDESGPRIGLVDQPYIGERFMGGLGRAEVIGPLGSKPLRVRSTTELSGATILTTFPEVGTAAEGRAFHAVAQECLLTRYGMDCYGYALLAAGHVDLVIEAGLKPYDIHAPVALVRAAGGIVTDWLGGPAHPGGRALAAATPELHAKALEIIISEIA